MDTLHLNKHEHREFLFVDEPVLDLAVYQDEGSSLRLHIINLKNQNAVNHIRIFQQAPQASAEIYGLAFVTRQHEVRTQTYIHHQQSHTTSNQLFKFVLADQAKGSFHGLLQIAPDAQKVNARQTNRNLLLSPQAKMNTKPQLEIYADDIQAAHGASTGQLDPAALFYMQQRGLTPQQSKQLLIAAFMNEILLTISNEKEREMLMQTMDSVLR